MEEGGTKNKDGGRRNQEQRWKKEGRRTKMEEGGTKNKDGRRRDEEQRWKKEGRRTKMEERGTRTKMEGGTRTRNDE